MNLPVFSSATAPTKKQIVSFGGINLAQSAAEGELKNSEGLSTRLYPCISQRLPRTVQGTYNAPAEVFGWGKLLVADGGILYYDGDPVGNVTAGEKQFAVVNTKLCVFPDKKYLDLTTNAWKGLDAHVTSNAGSTTTFTGNSLTMVTPEYVKNLEETKSLMHTGSYYEIYKTKVYTAVVWDDADGWTLTGESEPYFSSLSVGNIVMLQKTDIEGSYALNYRWYTLGGSPNEEIPYTDNNDRGYYAVITAVSVNDYAVGDLYFTDVTVSYDVRDYKEHGVLFSADFKAGDVVEISGCIANSGNNKTLAVTGVSDYTLTFADDSLTAGSETEQITVDRNVPDLDFVCSHDNRLWGCSNTDKTVYASALGDPTNLNTYDGLSTDSYAVAVGTDGDFTGCCEYSTSVLFWKEQKLHKLLGSFPAEYTLYTYDVVGVQAGSHKSMQIINEVLYFKGRDGVYTYTGGTPSLISYNFGIERFTDAIAGEDGQRYYISMKDRLGTYHLYTYDTLRGLWLREDGTRALSMTNLGGILYFISGVAVYKAGDESGSEQVEWRAEFTPFTETVNEKKCYSKLSLRFDLSAGAYLKAEISCDGSPWREVKKIYDSRSRTAVLPIIPTRCDSFRVRLSGEGGCVIRSLVREYQVGGER